MSRALGHPQQIALDAKHGSQQLFPEVPITIATGRPASTVRLLGAEMENMAGSEWSTEVLATRRRDGSLTLKVHQRSEEYGLEFRYRSRPVRSPGAFIDAWMEALDEAYLSSGDEQENLHVLLKDAFTTLVGLHPELAARLRSDDRVVRAAHSGEAPESVT